VTTSKQTHIQIDTQSDNGIISPHIYGHFAEHLGRCIYEGFWVGEDSAIPNTHGIRNDVLDALRKICIPVLRWPGGCFADEYHWRDGIGPRDQRKRMINTHWGGVIENNHFGTHEFLQLCELLGCEPYIAGNVGSGTVQEMQDWVDYMTVDGESPMANLRRANGREQPWHLKYFGVGNENWGCGGNMRPEYYADVYRRYQTYVRSYGANKIYKIACGSHDGNLPWTEVLMREATRYMHGLSLHYYTLPHTWAKKGSATEFSEAEWFITLQKAARMEKIISDHAAIMDKFDPGKTVGLIVDEWGTWYDVEPGTNPGFLYQQNTLRDALVAGITLNIFNAHCDRVHMANLAQTINVLQSVALTDGPRMVLTPTYHVFDLYQQHQGGTLLSCEMGDAAIYALGDQQMPQVSVSASRGAEGKVFVTLCNLDSRHVANVSLALAGAGSVKQVDGRVISAAAMNTHNTFEQTHVVQPVALANLAVHGMQVALQLPPMSVAAVMCSAA
jgi:alpha-N-arabinofuranosidase